MTDGWREVLGLGTSDARYEASYEKTVRELEREAEEELSWEPPTEEAMERAYADHLRATGGRDA